MKSLLTALLILASWFGLGLTDASAQTACERYRVQKGDTLREISKRAYGTENYRRIYRANRGTIGRNPNIISVGDVLVLPCRRGQTRAAVQPEAPAPTTSETLTLVTADGYLPYTDESLASRGLFTELVETAMMRAAPDAKVEVVFVNDWGAHLEHLLPRNAFDASFPWTPCGADEGCDGLIYSDPFYEIVDGFFARADSGLSEVIAMEGLAGVTICRPAGYPAEHLVDMDATIVHARGPHACFAQLDEGRVDLVALDTRTGDRVIDDLGLGERVVENPYLVTIAPLHVAAHTSNPRAEELLQTLNRGLGIMMESGEWASIVSKGLQSRPRLTN